MSFFPTHYYISQYKICRNKHWWNNLTKNISISTQNISNLNCDVYGHVGHFRNLRKPMQINMQLYIFINKNDVFVSCGKLQDKCPILSRVPYAYAFFPLLCLFWIMRNVLFIEDKLISTILSYLPLQTKPQFSQAFRFAIATKVVLTIYSFAKYPRCTTSHQKAAQEPGLIFVTSIMIKQADANIPFLSL